ncbi:S1C family serine protease [Geothrix oryzisoli]|uniref:S1C family serine protease n=1 Tax=Geothrix oryzisoli TaxID=2922721 RepID=UPI001FAD42FD|nr:trypsin-like peptidase domain-containing protein [Geothrix oryzisoli]
MRRSVLILGLLSAGLLAGWCGHALTPSPARPRSVETRGPLYEWEKVQAQRFREAAPSVVYITTTEERARDFFGLDLVEVPAGSGTGFIWDAQGHVVTNFHVIQGATRAFITLSDGSRHEAAYVGGAPDKDLAVLLMTKTPPKLRPIPLGTSADLQVGQAVLAIGNPFGLDQTLTTGVVSALGREIQSVTQRRISGVIQTDAAINPGNSGGPLLDSAGRLVGVNTAIQSPSGASAGIGFAMPVDTVNRVVPQLIARGKLERADLGFEPVAPRLVERTFGAQKGVMVGKVRHGGPAARAGLQGVGVEGRRVFPGDLIQAVNGKTVEDWDALLDAIEALPLGSTAQLDIQHEGRKLRVPIRLEAARE